MMVSIAVHAAADWPVHRNYQMVVQTCACYDHRFISCHSIGVTGHLMMQHLLVNQ